jgi:hypothetical protein
VLQPLVRADLAAADGLLELLPPAERRETATAGGLVGDTEFGEELREGFLALTEAPPGREYRR